MAQRKTAARARRQNTGGRTLSESQIIEAAIEIADHEGLDALTVRRLAQRLQVGTMTLYSYFRSKDEILDRMADNVLGGLKLPDVPDNQPQIAFRELGRAFLDMMRGHPSIVRLLSTRVTTSQHAMHGAFEQAITMLRKAGFRDELAVRAYGMIVTYTLGFVSYQLPRPWGRTDQPESAELCRQRRHFYASLPADNFPTMVELAEQMTTLPSNEQYDIGIDYLLAGLLADNRAGRRR